MPARPSAHVALVSIALAALSTAWTAHASGEAIGRTWGVEALGLEDAWSMGATGAGAPVAVIEIGRFDAGHPSLSGNVAWCVDLSGADGACDGHDADGHATHVAGIVRQVAPDAPLYLVSLSGSDASWPARVQAALDLAAAGPDRVSATADDARVASLSLAVTVAGAGGAPLSGVALAQRHPLRPPPGMLVVASAGNFGGVAPGTVAYPAADPAVVSVGAIGRDASGAWRVAPWSSDGVEDLDPSARRPGELDLAAPGVAVASALPSGQWGERDGTSAAAPHVAGLAALHASVHPSSTPAQARAALACGAVDLAWAGKYTIPGHDPSSGAGVPLALPVLSDACNPSR